MASTTTSNTLKKITYTPIFWSLFALTFLICFWMSFKLYPRAFPIVDLSIKMDRQAAMKAADNFAKSHHFGPASYQQAASFDLDNATQTYVELAAGGTQAFASLLKDPYYSPYEWKVRHFAEGNTSEFYISFAPDGRLYGYFEKIPEKAPGAALSSEKAQKIAESQAVQNAGINLTAYHLEEKSQEVQPSGRVDHAFVYERNGHKLGDARFRLRLGVSGDRLTEVAPYVRIPEAFLRRYAEMRSANNTITALSSTAMVILYIFGGCGLGMIFLAKKRWVLWRIPLVCAFIVAFFQFLEQINQLPLIWMGYDTALSAQGFLLRTFSSGFVNFLVDGALLALSFMVAEGLTRRAFPKHPQLWEVWKTKNASSLEILGRTVGGYLAVGISFLYIILIYLVGGRYLGWWTPSDILFQPNGLASYCPWFTAIANSLHAGFWEESLFRAVPLASAVLLGRWWEKKRGRSESRVTLWLVLGMVVQALIFASAHANYPAQPSYARVVELILPSLYFGAIYLRFGLLPGIILHFTFDVIMFAIPIFAAATTSARMDQILIVMLTLIPLWIVLFARLRMGGLSAKNWGHLSFDALNGAWQPKGKEAEEKELKPVSDLKPLNSGHAQKLGIAGVVCLILWLLLPGIKTPVPPLEVDRTQAIALAREALKNRGIELPPPWEALAYANFELGEDDRFIWKMGGESLYQNLLTRYLDPPSWIVRFVRFDGDVAERAEEYDVLVAKKGTVYRVRHDLPEDRKGAAIEKLPAQKLALQEIQKGYGLMPNDLHEVSSSANQLPARRDWLFVYSDPSVAIQPGEARIGVRITGDQVASSKPFVFIPEDWQRQERNRQNFFYIVRIFSTVFMLAIFCFGIIRAFLGWTRKQFATRKFFISFGILLMLGLVNFLNSLPVQVAQFSTQEPKFNQTLTTIAFGIISVLMSSFSCALIVGYLFEKLKQFPAFERDQQTQQTQLKKQNVDSVIGLSIGMIGAFVMSVVSRSLPKEAPMYGDVTGLGYWFPLLSGLSTLKEYIWMTVLMLLVSFIVVENITHRWTRRKGWGAFFIFVFSLCMTGLGQQNIASWLITSFVLCLYLSIALRYFVRSHWSLLPLASASIFILILYKQILLSPYPGSFFHNLLWMGVILLVSGVWANSMKRYGESYRT